MSRIIHPRSARIGRPLLSRRSLLGVLGAIAGASIIPRDAKSAPAEIPPLLLFTLFDGGWVWKNWRMAPPGTPASVLARTNTYDPANHEAPDSDAFNFDLTGLAEDDYSIGLRPLYRHRNQLLALDGLSMRYVTAQTSLSDAHGTGHIAAMTGNVPTDVIDGVQTKPDRPSIDQVIGRALRDADPSLTDLTTLEYSLGDPVGYHSFLFSGEPGNVNPLPAENDPASAYDRIFPFIPEENAPPDPVLMRQLEVLDGVAARYARLSTDQRLTNADRARLDSHAGMLADLAKKIETLSQLECSATDKVTLNGLSGAERYYAASDAFVDLIVVAMSCGLTRLATLQCYCAPVELVGVSGDPHDPVFHASEPTQEFNSGGPTDPFLYATEKATELMRLQTDHIARIADRFANVPDGQGGTLLDHASIVVSSEIAHGGHGHDNWPVMIVGNCGGAFDMGRYVRYPRNIPNPTGQNYYSQYDGLPHTRLLVSLAQAMGTGINDFGMTSVECTVGAGPNTGDSMTVDLTGPLEGLTA